VPLPGFGRLLVLIHRLARRDIPSRSRYHCLATGLSIRFGGQIIAAQAPSFGTVTWHDRRGQIAIQRRVAFGGAVTEADALWRRSSFAQCLLAVRN